MAELEPVKEIIDKKEKPKADSSLSPYHCDICGGDGHKTEGHGKNGGARKGGGVPKGTVFEHTKIKKAAKKEFDRRVMINADKLFNAQFTLAVGETVLMVKEYVGEGKNKKVKHRQITDVETIKKFLDENNGNPTEMGENKDYYYLSTRSPNNQAIDSLLNRGFGKPTEKIEIEGGNFFKADTLNIQIVSGHDIDKLEKEIIDVEPTS